MVSPCSAWLGVVPPYTTIPSPLPGAPCGIPVVQCGAGRGAHDPPGHIGTLPSYYYYYSLPSLSLVPPVVSLWCSAGLGVVRMIHQAMVSFLGGRRRTARQPETSTSSTRMYVHYCTVSYSTYCTLCMYRYCVRCTKGLFIVYYILCTVRHAACGILYTASMRCYSCIVLPCTALPCTVMYCPAFTVHYSTVLLLCPCVVAQGLITTERAKFDPDVTDFMRPAEEALKAGGVKEGTRLLDVVSAGTPVKSSALQYNPVQYGTVQYCAFHQLRSTETESEFKSPRAGLEARSHFSGTRLRSSLGVPSVCLRSGR